MSGHFVSPSFMADADAAELSALCDGLTETHANRMILLWRQMAQLTADIAAHCDPEPTPNVVGIAEHRARRQGHPTVSAS